MLSIIDGLIYLYHISIASKRYHYPENAAYYIIEDSRKAGMELLGSVQRNGIDKLMNYIRKKTDFYSAPASTRFHLACEGGLVQHSLNVYDCLVTKKENPIWQSILAEIPDESLIVMALLHDLCKANFYIEGTKNQKTYDAEKVAAAEGWQRKLFVQSQVEM